MIMCAINLMMDHFLMRDIIGKVAREIVDDDMVIHYSFVMFCKNRGNILSGLPSGLGYCVS